MTNGLNSGENVVGGRRPRRGLRATLRENFVRKQRAVRPSVHGEL